jgi:16S rRNA processing protein RimM
VTNEPSSGAPDPGVALLEVARIVKPHGTRGELVVELLTNRTERLDPGSVLYGSAASFQVERSRPFAGRFLVWFAGITSLAGAEALRDTVLCAPPLEDPDALWVHDLLGALVRDRDGTLLGRVHGVLANPASDLLELDKGGLIPLRFVVERTREGTDRVLVVDVPAGLLD